MITSKIPKGMVKIPKGMVLAGLGEKGLRKRDGQVGPVNPFPPRGSHLTSKIIWR